MHDIAVRRGIIIDRTPQRQEADRSISGVHDDIVERLTPRPKLSRLRATPIQRRSAVTSVKRGNAAPFSTLGNS